ncbi:hypothetical protein NDU88_004973 [Pleurodeles waltl]|uniref:Cadherin domain-containing protein n=1 Tax=Pleurodeles waltl TaxID=8319 RepID=A0AAV7SKD5_PLEWA|nr:hypothetical protein NDU88_004973 [Pleurodeles waltl]
MEILLKNSPEEPITLNEELPAGSLIFALQATDKDIDDTVHYEFVDIYKGFSINEDTGHITLSSRMDSEDGRHPPVRVVHVRAYDNDRVHPVTTQLSLSLLDVNDNSPRCEGNLIIIQLPETTPIDTSLLQLKCTDDDVSPPNNVLEYSMDLDAYSLNKFKLAHNEIILGPKRLDYDNLTFSGMQFKHTLIVRVSDKGEPSLTSE